MYACCLWTFCEETYVVGLLLCVCTRTRVYNGKHLCADGNTLVAMSQKWNSNSNNGN